MSVCVCVGTRSHARARLIGALLCRVLDKKAFAFDRWRGQVVLDVTAGLLQRVARGFLGRRRAAFIRFLITKAMVIQAAVRGLNIRRRTRQHLQKRRWAAISLQRIARGWLTRRRVREWVLGLVETQRKRLQQRKLAFLNRVERHAATRIQMVYRKFAVIQRVAARALLNEQKLQVCTLLILYILGTHYTYFLCVYRYID